MTIPITPLNGFAEAIAELTSEENTQACQVILIDGGSEVLLAGDSLWVTTAKALPEELLTKGEFA